MKIFRLYSKDAYTSDDKLSMRHLYQTLSRLYCGSRLQLAAVMMKRIRIIRRCTRGRFAPTLALWRAFLHIVPYGPWQFASVRNAASFFVHFVGVRFFSCGG